MSNPTTRCTACRATFTDAQLEGACACPNCQSKSVPSLIANDVPITINTHELRILFIWAENHARSIEEGAPGSSRLIDRLAQIVEAQLPADKWVPLTLSRELRDLRENLPNVGPIELHGSDGKVETF